MAEITLPQLRAVTGEHLVAASLYWNKGADCWRGVYGAVHTEAQALDWVGNAREGNMDRIAADHHTVNNNAEALEQAADIAWREASTLTNMARHATQYADWILEQGGYAIEPTTLLVENTYMGKSAAEWHEREDNAEQWTETLRFRAQNYVTHRDQVARDLIQAVDNKGQPPVHPDPNAHPNKKPTGFGNLMDDFGKVAAGAAGVVGGTILTGTSAAAEVGSDGIASPISIPGILGGLGMIAAGSGSVEKGLQDLFDAQ